MTKSPEPTPEPVPDPLDILHGDDTDFPGNPPAGWTPTQNSPDSPASDTHNSPEPVPDITWDGAAHSSSARTVLITSKWDISQGGGSASEWFAYIPYLRISIDRLAAERDAAQARISSLEEEREELRKAARELADLSATLPAFLTDAEFHAAAYTVHALLGDSQ